MAQNQISAKMRDCIASKGDSNSKEVTADSLMDISGFINVEKANALFEEVVDLVKLLPKPFIEQNHKAGGGGWTFLNLTHIDNGEGGIGEQWGYDYDAGILVLLCSYYGIVQDPHKTVGFKAESLKDMPGRVSYFLFNVEDNFLDMVRRSLGLTSVSTIKGLVIR